MPNPDAKLVENLFDEHIEQKPTRDGFGTGIVEAGNADPRVVVLCADLKESTRAEEFEKAFPTRFIEMGVAEQNMATVASGMAAAQKIPFITSYAVFSPGRNYEQIRTTVAINKANVKICGMHAGVSVGPDGATHQMLEDIGLMRMLPGMTVIAPADAEEARKAVIAVAKTEGPVYLRFGRAVTPVFTTPETPFQIGKANIVWKSDTPKVAIIATGQFVYNALCAAKELQEEVATTVINLHTIKPIDRGAVIAAAREAGAVVTVEEHQVAGGMGSAIAEVLAAECPVPIEFIGIHDQFGQSGQPAELILHYRMGVSHIQEAVRKVLARK